MRNAIKVLNVAFAIIVVGVMSIVWLAFNPAGLSAGAYIERQQAFIRALNVPMPLLGAATILLSLASAYLWRRDRTATFLFIVAALLLMASGIITRFCNQPINAIVMTWNSKAPPENWEMLRDEWWHWHVIRTLTGIAALGLLLVSHLRGYVFDSPVHPTA